MEIILEIAKNLKLPEDDIASIEEYIENNEWGLAFELLCIAIEQENIPVSKGVFRKIEKVGSKMELDNYLWNDLRVI